MFTEGSTFITVTIPYRVRHNIEKPTVAAFRKAQVRFYTTLVLFIYKTLQDNGMKNPMIYMLDMNTEVNFDIREIYSQTSDSDVSHEKITIK